MYDVHSLPRRRRGGERDAAAADNGAPAGGSSNSGSVRDSASVPGLREREGLRCGLRLRDSGGRTQKAAVLL